MFLTTTNITSISNSTSETVESLDIEHIAIMTVNTIASSIYAIAMLKGASIYKKLRSHQTLTAEEERLSKRLKVIIPLSFMVQGCCMVGLIAKIYNNNNNNNNGCI